MTAHEHGISDMTVPREVLSGLVLITTMAGIRRIFMPGFWALVGLQHPRPFQTAN